MQESEIYPALTDIFRDVFLRDDIVLKPELTAEDVEGWDSFKQVEILIACQERFEVKLRSSEIDRLGCVGDLVSLLKQKTEARV